MNRLPEGTDWLPLRHGDVDWRLHLLPVPTEDTVFIDDMWRSRNLDFESAVSTMARPKGQTRVQIQDMFRARQDSSDFHYAIALVRPTAEAGEKGDSTDLDVRYAGLISGIWCDDVSRVVEVGMTVLSDWRGKGIGTKAIVLFGARLWNLFRVRKLVAHVLSTNIPTRRMLESAGYSAVGELHQHFFVGGRFHDVMIFEKLLGVEES